MVSYSNKNDTALIEDAVKGENLAFAEIVNRYQGQVASVIMGMLGNTVEKEDVGQEVFIRFHKSLDQFKGESALGTYLTRIAINLSLNELKKRKKEHLRVVRDEVSMPDTADESANPERKDTKDMVQAALLKLEVDFRTVLVLRLIEGYSTKEVAEMLQIPLGTVLSRLARAQKKMHEILTPIIQ